MATCSLVPCLALVTATFVTAAAAHGGGYRGPVPVLPPSAGPASAPAGGNPGGVSITGASPAPGTGLAASTIGSGAVDSSRWQSWWEFNKDPYLQLKTKVTAARAPGSHPTLEQIDREVRPALARALRATRQPDLASACLVALGKIAPGGPVQGERDVFTHALRSGVQETRETAALALGITRRAWVADDLLALVADDSKGRRLVDRGHVDDRTRAFACYGAGLMAETAEDFAVRRRAVDALRDALRKVTDKDLDVGLAAVHGLRLASPPAEMRTLEAWALAQSIVDDLWRFATRRASQSQQLLQAHALLAVARLLANADSGTDKQVDTLVAELGEREGRHAALGQSAALALGFLARPHHEGACVALRRAALGAKDRQKRSFAVIALGQIGGDDNRAFLLQTLSQGHKVTVKPWAALALGVLQHGDRSRGGTQSAGDRTVGRALLEAMETVKTAEARGAFAIALGLAGYQEASPAMRSLLAESERQDELAGYLAVGLGLLGDPLAAAPMRACAQRALRRPQLLRQLAVGLGLLGEPGMKEHLLALLREGDLNVATLGAVAGALGQIGDAACVTVLTKTLENPQVPDLARAFAAAAIGGILDRAPLPWNASLSFGANYRSALPTLTDGLAGVLDIL